MKKILFLGAAAMQMPPLRYARERGYRVITADFKPDNPGHALADESHDVSTTDKDAVLELARHLRIDAVVAYASDPSAPTAAFVAEKMGLPGNPYESVLTLARKDLFRDFLGRHGFNVPRCQAFYDAQKAFEYVRSLSFPVFVKPVDSSGSKGVTRITEEAEFHPAFESAVRFSREKKVVIEESIARRGYQVAGDGFVVDGELRFRCWGNSHFDKRCNGLAPIGSSYPTIHPEKLQQVAHSETQRLISLLGLRNGALNFDFVFAGESEFYYIELGPRNGGNLIPEVIRYSTGVDMVKHTVEAALGNSCSELTPAKAQGFWSSYIVHAVGDGTCDDVWLSERVKARIVEQNIWVKRGDSVRKFSGAHETLGTMILRYESQQEMLEMMESMERDIRVEVS
jgi:biotin carboxylase